MLYNSYMAINYGSNSSIGQSAEAQVKKDYEEALAKLAELRDREPNGPETAEVAPILARLNSIVDRAIGYSKSGKVEQARQSLAEGDRIDRSFSPKLRAMIIKRQEDGLKLSTKLSDQAKFTVINLYTVAIIGLLGGIALAIFVVRASITGPLARLQTQMGGFASGDYREAVFGQDRGDEVGQMAKAVAVFRENGIAKETADAAKARADAEQKMVVDTVSGHLSDLSDGDLTVTIAQEFPPEYAGLKSNFNEALGKLRDLIGAVSESATTIRTGSGEIAQA
ncbi:HAMP domain-containing protein, partial [Sphingomonas mollis]